MKPLYAQGSDDADDLQAAVDTIDELDLKPFDLTQPRGFTGMAEASKGLLRPSAGAARTLLMAGAPVAGTLDWIANLNPERKASGESATGFQDAYFGAVEDIGNTAVDYFTPDPHAMGTTARVLNTVGNVVGSVPQMIGTPSVFLANAATDPAADLVRQGVDADTATAVGVVNLAVNAAGMRLPAAFGSTLTARMATGAAGNLVTGAAADEASAALLERGGYGEAAASYDPADPYARGLDLLMGLAFGAHAHVEPRATPAQRDAVLVAMNADHAQRVTRPGTPKQPGADVRHQQALSQAIAQILAGDRVDAAHVFQEGDFDPPAVLSRMDASAEAPAVRSLPSYAAYRRALESGGNAEARNPRSSAFGIDQFTAVTWRAVVAKAKPAWAEGLSDAELLALRRDPAKSGEMAMALDAENARALQAAGLEASHHNLYAAHHFGAERAVAFAKAAGDVPMTHLLTASQIKANPYLAHLTKAEAVANWDARARRAGVDMGRQPTERVPAEPIAETRPAPRPDIAALRSGVEAVPEPPRDATLEEFAAWREGQERRALVSERAAVEAQLAEAPPPADEAGATAHPSPEQARARLAELEDAEATLAERHAPSAPEVRSAFNDWASRTAMTSLAGREPHAVAADLLARVDAGEHVRQFDVSVRKAGDSAYRIEDARDAGARSGEAARGVETLDRAGTESRLRAAVAAEQRAARPRSLHAIDEPGQREGREVGAQDGPTIARAAPERGNALERARAIAATAGELRIATGELDADGTPKTSTAAELLAQAEAEAQRAALDAEAVEAAAECFLRSAA